MVFHLHIVPHRPIPNWTQIDARQPGASSKNLYPNNNEEIINNEVIPFRVDKITLMSCIENEGQRIFLCSYMTFLRDFMAASDELICGSDQKLMLAD